MISSAAAQTPGVDPILAPGVTQLLSQGLLGAAVLFLIWVIWTREKEMKLEREKCMTAYGEVLKLGGTFAQSNSDVARALEERNRITQEMVQTNARLSDAVSSLTKILDLHHREITTTLQRLESRP